LHKYFIPFRIS